MKKLFILFAIITAFTYAFKTPTLKGTYKYAGSVFNGKLDSASREYDLQRKYDDTKFEAFLLEPGQQPYKYQAGNYSLQADTCLETETFSAQPSKLTGKTIHYSYQFHRDTLILKGILPNGKPAEEHWVKEK